MDNKIEKQVIVKTRDGKSSSGKVIVQRWSRKGRVRRSLKILGFIWILAVLSVFLPIAHFILVPVFFIAGPIVAHFIYKQESAVVGGESLCPNCGKQLPIVSGPNKWPLEDLCSNCQTHVLVEMLNT